MERKNKEKASFHEAGGNFSVTRMRKQNNFYFTVTTWKAVHFG